MNLIFKPMFAQGMAGMLRRMADGGANYSQARAEGAIGGLSPGIIHLHTYILWAAVGLGLAQIPFIINLFWSIRNGQTGRVGQPLGGDHPGMADAHTTAARELRQATAGLPGAVRIQRAGPDPGLHAAEPT